ncbi:Cell division control protein 6 [Chlorella vulgaris]
MSACCGQSTSGSFAVILDGVWVEDEVLSPPPVADRHGRNGTVRQAMAGGGQRRRHASASKSGAAKAAGTPAAAPAAVTAAKGRTRSTSNAALLAAEGASNPVPPQPLAAVRGKKASRPQRAAAGKHVAAVAAHPSHRKQQQKRGAPEAAAGPACKRPCCTHKPAAPAPAVEEAAPAGRRRSSRHAKQQAQEQQQALEEQQQQEQQQALEEQQQQAQQQQEQEEEEEKEVEIVEPLRRAAHPVAAAAPPQQQQQQQQAARSGPAPPPLQRPVEDSMHSRGVQASQARERAACGCSWLEGVHCSVHESILKSPTPTRRSKAAASTAGVAPRALMAAGGGDAAAAAAAAAFAVAAAAAEQGAVDQPAPQQQQQQQQQQGQPEAAAAGGFAAAEPAAAAAAVLPDLSVPEAGAGVGAEAEAALGCTGSSPVTTPPAKRQRTLTDQQPQQQQKLQQRSQQTQQQAQQQQGQQQQGQQPGSAERSASRAVQAAAAAAGVSPRRHSPRQKAAPGASQVTALPAARPPRPSLPSTPSAAAAAAATSGSPGASTAAAPGLAAGAASAPAWWDLLDASKVREVKAALHVGSYATGSIPVCREREAAAVGGWLQRQLAQRQGGSIYLSGLPGTGTSRCVALHCIGSCKSLTAHEVVRQCWRPAPPSPSACAGEVPCGGGAAAAAVLVPAPPPALLSINCMSITDPHQVAERILLGYAQACAAPHPEAVAAAGQDTIVYPTAAEAGGGGVAASRRKSDGDLLKQLRQLSQAPMPPAAVPVAAAAHAAASPPAKAHAKARRGTKRKSSLAGRGGAAAAAEAAAAASDGCASAGCARGMLVVVLDELDALLSGSKGEKLMESLFAMAAADGSRLLLLGIANSVDLVQRLMRPGGALHRRNLKPAHEIFATYLSRQFSQVLHQRLGALPGQVFDGKAIELCSRKMANGSGDMRWALEACSQALELAVKEAAAAAAAAASEVAAVQEAADRPAGAAAASSGPPPSRLVGLRHMAAALSRITGGIGLSNTNVQAIRALPPQQKLLVCTAGKLLGDSLGSRGLTVLKPSHMPTPGGSRKAGGTSAAAGRAKATFMSPANSAASSIKSAASLASGAASGVVRSREVLLWQLEKAFSDLCKQASVGMDPYDSLEFGTACEALQDRGLLGLSAARDPKWRRVTLQGRDARDQPAEPSVAASQRAASPVGTRCGRSQRGQVAVAHYSFAGVEAQQRRRRAERAVGSSGGDPVQPERRGGQINSEPPVYDEQQLLHSLGLNGPPAELRRSMSKLQSGTRQQGVVQHAAAVAAHLRGLGLEQQLLEELFVRCPELFSWPPEERAEGLFSELMSSLQAAAMRGFSTPSAVLQHAPSRSVAAVLSAGRPLWHIALPVWRLSGGGGLSGAAIEPASPQGSLRLGSSSRWTCACSAVGSNDGDPILPKRISKMNGIRQQGVLQHAVAVVAHLRGLSLEQHFLEELFGRDARDQPAERSVAASQRLSAGRSLWHTTALPVWRLSGGGGELSGAAIKPAPPQGSLRLGSSSRWACGCSGASSAVSSNGGDPVQPKQRRGLPKSEAPSYDAQQLLHSLGLNGSPAELRRSMSKLRYGARQQQVLQYAAAVVAHLRGLGLEQQLLEELFVRCPELFSWPAEERAEGLFSELMSSGLTAAEAARCFVAVPQAARYISFAGSIAVVDEILVHSQDSNRGAKPKVPAAERTAAAMLRADPSSVQIIRLDATKLRRQCDRLVTLGCSPAAVAKLLWRWPSLLCCTADSVAQLEQAADVLHDELGLAPEMVLELVASNAPSWMNSSQDTLRRRAAALAEEFGRDDAASIVVRNALALNCDTSVWQRNLHYITACDVGDARAVLLKTPGLLSFNHAASDFVARRLLLQRCTGLSAAQLYQQHAHHLTRLPVEQLALRLQYVEHRQSLLDDGQQLAGGVAWPWPLCQLTYSLQHKTYNPGFLVTLGSGQQEWDAFAAAHPAGSGPVWEWAQQEAGAEVQRLVGVLPPELQQAAADVRPQYKSRRAGTSLV